MQRKLTLSKNAYLWEEGDQARNIAVVEQGKLAVQSGNVVIGIVLPKMVVGEAAINGSTVAGENGNGSRRSASALPLSRLA